MIQIRSLILIDVPIYYIIGRNMDDNLVEYCYFAENGINLQFVKEPMLNTDSQQDDVILKAIQQAVLVVLTAFAEKERDEIRCRQDEGIEVAKRNGVKFGRPSLELPTNWNELYDQWKTNN